MIRFVALFLAVLALTNTAAAQLTAFESRALTPSLFQRVHQDVAVALAFSNVNGTWPEPKTLPFGSRLTFTAEPDSLWRVEFEADPFQESESLAFGPTAGTLVVGFATNQACRTVYEGTVSNGWLEWGSRGRLDAAGAASSLVSCHVQTNGAG